MLLSRFLLLASLITLVVAPRTVLAAQVDPGAILEDFYGSMNRGDVAAAVSLFTEDPFVVHPGCIRASPCTTKDELQRTFGQQVVGQAHYEVKSMQASGDTVIVSLEWSRTNMGPGIDRVFLHATASIAGNRIARLVVHDFDLSDPQTAAFAEMDRVGGVNSARSRALLLGDVDGMMALFSDDAVFEGLGLCAEVPCLGNAPIRSEMERQVAEQTRLNPVPGSRRIRGSTEITRVELRSESVSAAGFERIIAAYTSVVEGDQIVHLRMLPDARDLQTLAFLVAQQGQATSRL